MRTTNLLLVAALVGLLVGPTSAAVYTYTPVPGELWELDHHWYYTWGIEWTHTDEVIVDAVLTYYDIYDWRVEEGDYLYSHLLDNPALGTTRSYDGQGGGDYFAGETWIGTWSDPIGGQPRGFDLVYDFSDLGLVDDLSQMAADGVVGIGIDADCHYYNDGVELQIVTSTVPEPGSIALLGLGLAALGARLRRRK
jgi:hypothetical protein